MKLLQRWQKKKEERKGKKKKTRKSIVGKIPAELRGLPGRSIYTSDTGERWLRLAATKPRSGTNLWRF